MARKNSQFRSQSTISCCRHCVPPKRHTACWDHCPEYQKERAEYDVQKAKEKVRKGLDAQMIASVNRAKKGGK